MPSSAASVGYGYEYCIFSHLISAGSTPEISSLKKIESRKTHYDTLQESKRTYLSLLAQKVIDNLKSHISLENSQFHVPLMENNRSDVYDVTILNGSSKINLSIKSNDKVEDKAYRFTDSSYPLENNLQYMRNILFDLNKSGFSIEDALKEKEMSVGNFIHQNSLILENTLKNEHSPDHQVFKNLCFERLIGKGGYFKTLKNGELRFYPDTSLADNIKIEDVIRTTNTTVKFKLMFFQNSVLLQSYVLDFRIKFKDGKNKPVNFNTKGAMSNIAATVRIIEMEKVQ